MKMPSLLLSSYLSPVATGVCPAGDLYALGTGRWVWKEQWTETRSLRPQWPQVPLVEAQGVEAVVSQLLAQLALLLPSWDGPAAIHP